MSSIHEEHEYISVIGCCPITVALAQHLQTKECLTFQHLWDRLMRMCNPSNQHRPVTVIDPFEPVSSHDHASTKSYLQTIEAFFRDRFSVQLEDTCMTDTLSQPQPFQFILWNCRGLKSSLPAIHHILDTQQPLALILTETHLQSRQTSSSWIRHIHPNYETFASCHPQQNPLGHSNHPCPSIANLKRRFALASSLLSTSPFSRVNMLVTTKCHQA